jgi:hypothetical protein
MIKNLQYYTVNQAAIELDMSPQGIYKWLSEFGFHEPHHGKRRKIHKDEMLHLLKIQKLKNSSKHELYRNIVSLERQLDARDRNIEKLKAKHRQVLEAAKQLHPDSYILQLIKEALG